MKAINYLYKICCLIFGHEYKNIGNQNGRYLKCVRCGQRINKDKWEHNAIVFGEKAKRAKFYRNGKESNPPKGLTVDYWINTKNENKY